SGSGRVPQSHSMLFEAPGQQSRLRNRHKPDEAPWIDPDQAVRPRMLEDPFPECLFPEFLLQVSIGQHVHRKYIEDMLMTMPLRRADRLAAPPTARSRGLLPIRELDRPGGVTVQITESEVVRITILAGVAEAILRSEV